MTDAERLHERQLAWVDALAVVDALRRHGDVVRESALALHAHRLVVRAAVDEAAAAGIAGSAVEVGIAGHELAGAQGWAVRLHDDGGELMANGPGIGDVKVRPAIGAQIAAADAAVEQPQKGFPLTPLRHLRLLHLDMAGLREHNAFHGLASALSQPFTGTSASGLKRKPQPAPSRG